MESIGSTKLKTSLNSYLKQVQKGFGFIVSDRGRPVAKLVPIDSSDLSDPDEIMASLISNGVIELEDISSQKILKERKIKAVSISGVSASDLLLKSRD